MNIEEIQPRIEELGLSLENLKARYEEHVKLTVDNFLRQDDAIKELKEFIDTLEGTVTIVPDVDETENRKKRLAKIEERLEAVEAALTDPESEEQEASEPEPDAASDNDTAADDSTAPDFSELQAAVADDIKEYSQSVVNTAFYSEVCKKFNCWETVQLRDGEKGQSYPLRLPDAKYYVPSRDMLDRILKDTKVDEVEWVKDKEDCEDIARLFVQRCNDIGINSVGRVCAWSGGHAFCVAIVQDGTSVDFVFLEPQTDEIITDMKDMYDITNALIIIS